MSSTSRACCGRAQSARFARVGARAAASHGRLPAPALAFPTRSQHARPLPRRRAAPGALQRRRQVGHGG